MEDGSSMPLWGVFVLVFLLWLNGIFYGTLCPCISGIFYDGVRRNLCGACGWCGSVRQPAYGTLVCGGIYRDFMFFPV